MNGRTVAVFDFDGTLTRRDTLLPFLRRTRGAARTASALLATSLLLARDRDAAKEGLLRRLLAGAEVDELQAAARAFADVVIQRGLRPSMLARVQSHKADGHELVIVTASPELYVGPIGERLGFDAVLGTQLETDGNGHLTGRLQGRNCRGVEKVNRLKTWLGAEAELYAYGDSSGDRALWELADHAYRVRRGRLLVVGVSSASNSSSATS